ncbi:DUF3850 domain-containing protein [Escherichia coli]|uniref:DUF3850 domain-containing protein n=1 Tax=Escherichia coli TaxID=562 RepID=UPI0034CE2879
MAEYKCPIVHKLKILPKYFAAVCAGIKRAELRKNDRDYRAGDVLILEEALPGSDMTGKSVCVRITHVADVSDYAPGYVLLSIAQVWIPCSERLPDEGEYVLTHVTFNSDLVTPLVCTARWTGDTFRRGGVTAKPGRGDGQVTHWMPLPEPPINVTVKE